VTMHDLLELIMPKKTGVAKDSAGANNSPMRNIKIKDIMTDSVVTVKPGSTVREAVDLMLDRDIHSLVVFDGRVRGILTRTDVLLALAALEKKQVSNPNFTLQLTNGSLVDFDQDYVTSSIKGFIKKSEKYLGRGTINLNHVQTLVLDEADRMTDMGFYEEIAGIVSACPARRQTLLFSATYPEDIRRATASFLVNPLEVTVEAQHDNDKIEQRFYEIGFDERNGAVGKLLKHFKPESTLAFCNTKVHCRELAEELRQQGFSALALYGELEQRERDEILVLFANRSCSVLVGHRRRRARPRYFRPGCGDQRRRVERHGSAHPPHRPHGPRQQEGWPVAVRTEREKWVKLIEQYQNSAAEWHDLKELAEDDGIEAPAGADGHPVHHGRQEGQAAPATCWAR